MTNRLDEAALTRMATDYLARYAAPAQRLRRVLDRRVRRWHAKRELPVPDDAADLIGRVVARLVDLNLVDDRAFAVGKARSLVRKGFPERRIRAALRSEGLDAEATDVADVMPADEVAQARRFAVRKRLGRYGGDREAKRDKDMRALLRAGFSFRAATSALDPDPDVEEGAEG